MSETVNADELKIAAQMAHVTSASLRAHATRLEALDKATYAATMLSQQAEGASDKVLAQRASELGLLIATEWHKVVEGDK